MLELINWDQTKLLRAQAHPGIRWFRRACSGAGSTWACET